MTKEQIECELIELDGQLSGLCDSIEIVDNYVAVGIDESSARAWPGTIHTLYNAARLYHEKYNALSCKIINYLHGLQD